MQMNRLLEIIRETDAIFFDDVLRMDVKEKGDADFVTRADIEISNYLHRRLAEEFPEVGFLSEEETMAVDVTGDYWILDPIDGTTNFMHGLALSAVSLGYCSGGEVTAGVIYIPYAKELYWAEKGKGAFCNGEPIACSKHTKLSDCLGLYEFNAYFKNEKDAALAYAEKIYLACQDIRTLGSAAVELAYVACGKADVFFGRYLKPWDYAAGLAIIREAGGSLSEPDGTLHIAQRNRNIIATNGAVHEAFAALIRG